MARMEDFNVHQVVKIDPEITLRDYFAGQALVGAISANELPKNIKSEDLPDAIAKICFLFADAMLKAREEG